MSNFYTLDIVCRGSETQLQVGENLHYTFKKKHMGSYWVNTIAIFSCLSFLLLFLQIGGDILHDNQGDQSLVMHMARDLPAGIHLYYSISGNFKYTRILFFFSIKQSFWHIMKYFLR